VVRQKMVDKMVKLARFVDALLPCSRLSCQLFELPLQDKLNQLSL